jgi:hypothetical protein
MSEFMKRCGRSSLTSAAVTVLTLTSVSSPVSAAVPTMVLNSAIGPSGGGNTLVATVPGAAMTFLAGAVPTVQFQHAGTGSTPCSPSAQVVTQITASGTITTTGVQTVEPGTVKRITARKIAFEVPSSSYPAVGDDGVSTGVNPDGLALTGTQTFAKWNVCVYDSDSIDSGTLLATASYTVAVRPSITSIVPANSPSLGGRTITVNGTGFSSVDKPISGSIGGAPLTDIKVAANGESFTAVTAPRSAASGLALTLNTPGGRVSSLDPDNNGRPEDADPATADTPITFDYTRELTRIEPNTAPAGSTITLDVFGAGFSQLTFGPGGDPTSSDAHVFLVDDVYEPSSNRGVAECDVLLVVSDIELICSLDLSAEQLNPVDSMPMLNAAIAEGPYILTVVANGAPDAGADAKPTIVSSGAAFTVSPAPVPDAEVTDEPVS